jgi:hypothetical protein
MSRVSHLLTQTVTWATWTTKNNSGDPTWGSQSTAAARVEFGLFKTRNSQGVEVDVKAKVTTETNIPRKARIWLPGDDTTKGNEARKIVGWTEKATPSADLTLYGLFL